MNRHLFIFYLLGGLAFNLSAQDQLFKKDNSKVLVKITEVNPDEIKYKLFSNLSGPTYIVSKSEVSLIIYENGQHEVVKSDLYVEPARAVRAGGTSYTGIRKEDSLRYFRYSENISMNFLNFLNMEVGLIYQKDFFRSNFSIIVPVAVGLEKPGVTQSVYFGNSNANTTLWGGTSYPRNLYQLNKKMFEVGLGLNYYPSLRGPVNYYIGPTFRYMQYNGTQTYGYQNPNVSHQIVTITKNSTMARYCFSITNGLVFRTRSRLLLTMFGSIGFKNDVFSGTVVDPNTNEAVQPPGEPFSLYWWSGFTMGFAF